MFNTKERPTLPKVLGASLLEMLPVLLLKLAKPRKPLVLKCFYLIASQTIVVVKQVVILKLSLWKL